MKPKSGKFSFFPKLDRLEVYLLAADNPIGKKQLRPIFRRKRSREVLTREQVTAIKRGRRVLRREMKEQGLKRRIDFEVTATNLGLYFDRNRFLWPIILWFMQGNTAVKILATTAVLTTLVTVMQPVIEYVTQYVTQYVNRYVNKYVDRYQDRFTISVSDEMLKRGFELSDVAFDDPDFKGSQEILFAVPVTQVPCVSIGSIPYDIDDDTKYPNGTTTDFFHYTFYCRYTDEDAENDPENDDPEVLKKYAASYKWGLRIHAERVPTQENATDPTEAADTGTGESQLKTSDAIWVMIIQDGEVILCAKEELNDEGEAILPLLPSDEVLQTKRVAFHGRSEKYLNEKLAEIDPLLNVDNAYDLESLYPNDPVKVAGLRKQIDQMLDDGHVQDLQRMLLRTGSWSSYYKEVTGDTGDGFSYYQIKAEKFKDPENNLIMEGTRKGMLPWIDGVNEEYHKYTIVAWLEGDDPQCTNELMGSYIGMNFQIVEEGGSYTESITVPVGTTESTESTAAG